MTVKRIILKVDWISKKFSTVNAIFTLFHFYSVFTPPYKSKIVSYNKILSIQNFIVFSMVFYSALS